MANLDKGVLLSSYGDWNVESSKNVYIDKLEDFIAKNNKVMDKGADMVSDSEYCTLIDYLRELRPDSPLLCTKWGVDTNSVDFSTELDTLLNTNPIFSISTVSSVKDKTVKQFKEKLYNYPTGVLCSIKLKGYKIRVVYKDGVLVKATARGRSNRGVDLTRQAIVILDKKSKGLKGRGIVELRGDLVLSTSNLDKARSFNPSIQSTLSGVASLIQCGVSDKDIKLLDIIFSDIVGYNLMFSSLTERYQCIENLGFETPLATAATVEKYSLEDDLLRIVGKMEVLAVDYPYSTDGVIVTVNNEAVFLSFGIGANFEYGSMLLKIGMWKQDTYKGVISEIKWLEGKYKKTPVAILRDGVTIDSSIVVTTIPLYAPCYILMLEAYVDNLIYFRYGGIVGAIPTTVDGKLVIDKTNSM